MSSDRKIEANRANAAHSTGPQTEAGKAASSQNARRHGLSSATVFIPEGRAGEFKAMFTAYFDEIRPVGELQMTYFEQMVHAAWNLDIARTLLVRALADLDDKKISNANRYVAQYERSFARAHKAIKDEQTDLALRAVPENEAIADLPITCRIRAITNEATKLAQRQPPAVRAIHRHAVLDTIGQAFRPPSLKKQQNEATEVKEAA